MTGIPDKFWWVIDGSTSAPELYEGQRDKDDARRDQDAIARHIGHGTGIGFGLGFGDEDCEVLIFDSPDGPAIARLTIEAFTTYRALGLRETQEPT